MIITLPTKKSARDRKAKARKTDESMGRQGEQQKQVTKPDLDSVALHRRAKELSTEIQREYIVESNNEKVERIRAELEKGTYQVDADSIAEKLMEKDFQLEDRPKKR